MSRPFGSIWWNFCPWFGPAARTNGIDVTALHTQVQQQAAAVQALRDHIDEIAKRPAVLGEAPEAVLSAAAERQAVPCSSPVIDAREIGFRPCLKPAVYAGAELICPGNAVTQDVAVRGGNVRYYRRLGRAQQSLRAGALPLTIQAVDTSHGERSVTINTEAARQIQMAYFENAYFKVDLVEVAGNRLVISIPPVRKDRHE